MLAYDYPLLGLFWSMLIFFLFVAWLILLFRVFADIFRTQDMGGWAKGIWSIFVILLPFLGVFIYLIVNGRAMGERAAADAQQHQAAFDTYVRQTAGTAGPADELQKLAALRDNGTLTDAEFAAQKAKLLDV